MSVPVEQVWPLICSGENGFVINTHTVWILLWGFAVMDDIQSVVCDEGQKWEEGRTHYDCFTTLGWLFVFSCDAGANC